VLYQRKEKDAVRPSPGEIFFHPNAHSGDGIRYIHSAIEHGKKPEFIMKKSFALLLLSALLVGTQCGRVTEKSSDDNGSEADVNKVLYNEVMDIHDEVMPKMGELSGVKRRLQEKIKNTPDMPEATKQELESTIQYIDSANHMMMEWMHLFQPDSLKGDELKTYLESEKERVTQVKKAMLDALEKGKAKEQ
jgi:hypothetical protein